MTVTAEVILLNWNGRDFLADCLEHLYAQTYPSFRVTFVDNGSTDDSVSLVETHFPQVTVRTHERNVGFAAGNNPSLKASSADIAILLNPDVMVSPDWLASIMERFRQDEKAAIVGCKLWYPEGRVLQHAGGFIRPPQAMPGHYGIGEEDQGQYDTPRECDYVIGAALAVRTAVLPQLGLLDEGYFLYYEDVDFCRRAHHAGWRVVYEPSATGIHIESATAVKGSFSYLHRFHGGRWRYLLKQETDRRLIEETFSTETEWLERIDLGERQAVALAYEATLASLDEILNAREESGAGPVSSETTARLRDSLTVLRNRAWELPVPVVVAANNETGLTSRWRRRVTDSTPDKAWSTAVEPYLQRISGLLREQTVARHKAESEVAALRETVASLKRRMAQSSAESDAEEE